MLACHGEHVVGHLDLHVLGVHPGKRHLDMPGVLIDGDLDRRGEALSVRHGPVHGGHFVPEVGEHASHLAVQTRQLVERQHTLVAHWVPSFEC